VKRHARIHWSALVFLVFFTVFLIAIATYTLKPGMEAATRPGITAAEKHRLVAWYRLLLTVVLFILFAGLILTVRIGRFFFPRDRAEIAKTQYVDAWAESAKRVQVPSDEGDEVDEGG
jgi:hypothetical protein